MNSSAPSFELESASSIAQNAASKADWQHIQLKEVSIFSVPLQSYPMQPWAKAAAQVKNAVSEQQKNIATHNLRQWFNYGFTPSTWQAYANQQEEIKEELLKLAPVTSAKRMQEQSLQ